MRGIKRRRDQVLSSWSFPPNVEETQYSKCVRASSYAGLSCQAARVMLQGRPLVSWAGWQGGGSARASREATSDLGPEPSGDRRSPGPTLWAEAADRREVLAAAVRVSGEQAQEAVEERAGLPHPTLGAGEGAQADSPSDGGRAGAAARGPTSPPRRRALRSAGGARGRRARPAAEDGGPPGLPRNLKKSSCCGSSSGPAPPSPCSSAAGQLGRGRPLRGHLGRDA